MEPSTYYSNEGGPLNTSTKLAELLLSEGIRINSFVLEKDSKTILIGIFDSLRCQYPTEFAELDNEFTVEKANNFVQMATQKIFSEKILQPLSQMQSDLPPFFQQLINYASEGRMPSVEDLNFQQTMNDFEKEQLIFYQQTSGNVASSLEEMLQQKCLKECENLILTTSLDRPMDDILERLLREASFRSFYKNLSQEIINHKPGADKSQILKFLDALIKDYISSSPSKFWRTHPDFNYHYAFSQIEKIVQDDSLEETHFLYNRMKTASTEILPTLEAVLEGFLQTSSEIEILKNHLPWILFGKSDDILLFMHKVGLKKGDRRHSAALSGFLESVVKFVSSQSKNQGEIQLIHDSLYIPNIILFIRLKSLPTLEEIGLTLTPLQINLLEKILGIYNANAQSCFNNAKELLEVVDPESKIKRAPMLGIGFSGPLYEPHPTLKENCLYLNFSSQFRSKEVDLGGLPILYGIRTLLTPVKKDKPNYKIHVLDNLGETDNQLFTYITHQLIDAFCQSYDLLHPNFKNNLKAALLQSLQDKLELQKQRISTCESHIKKKKYVSKNKQEIATLIPKNAILIQLIELINKDRFSEIEEAHRSLLKSVLDEAERRICVETVITQATGNPYTLSFARKPEMGEPVLMDGEVYKFGDNILIQPCKTRCQMLGVAHTLLGDLKHLPSVQQAHERSLNRNGDGIQPIVSENCIIS